jgi:hypothetical protein
LGNLRVCYTSGVSLMNAVSFFCSISVLTPPFSNFEEVKLGGMYLVFPHQIAWVLKAPKTSALSTISYCSFLKQVPESKLSTRELFEHDKTKERLNSRNCMMERNLGRGELVDGE